MQISNNQIFLKYDNWGNWEANNKLTPDIKHTTWWGRLFHSRRKEKGLEKTLGSYAQYCVGVWLLH